MQFTVVTSHGLESWLACERGLWGSVKLIRTLGTLSSGARSNWPTEWCGHQSFKIASPPLVWLNCNKVLENFSSLKSHFLGFVWMGLFSKSNEGRICLNSFLVQTVETKGRICWVCLGSVAHGAFSPPVVLWEAPPGCVFMHRYRRHRQKTSRQGSVWLEPKSPHCSGRCSGCSLCLFHNSYQEIRNESHDGAQRSGESL